MEKLKSLTPEQRERVTELMYEAEEMESKNEEMQAELFKRSSIMQQRAKSEIFVAEMIYPGVKIRLPGVDHTVVNAIQGPVRLAIGNEGGASTIVVMESGSGSSYSLRADVTAEHGNKEEQPAKAAA